MEQDEITEDVELTEQDDAEEAEQAPEEQAEQTSEQTPDELAKARAEAAKWRRLFEKAQKAQVQSSPSSQPSPSVDVDERILKANGMPEGLLKELKAVAAVRNVSLIDAQNDDLFVAVKEKFEREEKSRKAALGASRGSGRQETRKTVNTPGLTREEHMRLVKGG